MQAIIYTSDNGGVSILYPTGELAIEEVAKKDVPAGKPYKIVDVSEIPTDRTFRSAWEWVEPTPEPEVTEPTPEVTE